MHNQINNFYLEFYEYIDYNKKQYLKEKYEYLYRIIKRKIFKSKTQRKFIKHYKHLDKFINKYNKKYIKNNLNLDLFNNINGISIDNNQRKAVLTDEINNLVIAGAGSGKTLTIVAKIKYLTNIKNINKKEILCISFTNESCNSLKNKIDNIEVLTFHKLALKILNKKKYNISNISLEYIVDEYFKSIIYNNESMIVKVLKIYKYKPNINNYQIFLKSKHYKQLQNIIITFINIFKTNNYSLEKILKIKKNNNKDLLSIILDIYILYEQELKSINSIDFNDMINKATKEVFKHKIVLPYKYIIIDEFQDTSYQRYNLIKTIIDNNHAKLIVVGDDWQSIYGFTGCNLDIFINFEKYFGYTKKIYLNNTYRNSQELIDTASKFILKNKKQLKKKLISNKHINKPIKIIYEKENILEYLIEYIIKQGIKNILILGRNNNDIYKYLNNNLSINNEIITYKHNKNILIKYLTVHKSKGLEEETVILINLVDNILGFPNQIKNNNIIELLNDYKIDNQEEERRLFYVALTRTKGNTYLIIPNKNISTFAQEIIKENKKNIEYIY